MWCRPTPYLPCRYVVGIPQTASLRSARPHAGGPPVDGSSCGRMRRFEVGSPLVDRVTAPVLGSNWAIDSGKVHRCPAGSTTLYCRSPNGRSVGAPVAARLWRRGGHRLGRLAGWRPAATGRRGHPLRLGARARHRRSSPQPPRGRRARPVTAVPWWTAGAKPCRSHASHTPAGGRRRTSRTGAGGHPVDPDLTFFAVLLPQDVGLVSLTALDPDGQEIQAVDLSNHEKHWQRFLARQPPTL